MIRRLDFPLCKRAFVRQEGELFYLFHGDTKAVLELADDPMALWDSPDPEVRETVRRTLIEEGFVDGAAGTAAEGEVAALTPDELKDIEFRFQCLRSDEAPLVVLWGIGGHCNLRCIYCFPDVLHERYTELSAEEARVVATKIIDAAVLEVTLSGGEPLLRKDLFEIAGLLRARNLAVSMMTNGTLLTDEHARRMAELDLSVGVSLDSLSEEVNRITRGDGVVDQVKRAVDVLARHDVGTNLVVTVTRHNFDGLETIFEYARAVGMTSIMLQDLRGFGTRELYESTRLTDEQEDAVPALIDRLEAAYPEIYVVTLELLMYKHRELPCPSGRFSIYIDPAGDVFPCTALPTYKMGNAVHDELTQLWQSSPAITRLREGKSKQPPTCGGCDQWDTCLGGCRGDAIFYTGERDGIPSRCPRNRRCS
jgi:radical SAM protein with 4Fe4S-binding SPASM domain